MIKPVVAIIYDFDKTLCTKDMQEYGFIPSVELTSSEFWQKVNALTNAQHMDSILAYMYTMLEEAKLHKIAIQREDFTKLGTGVEYFAGVLDWFDRISQFGKAYGVRIEHYIVSSGIKEIIEGTCIADKFERIYACEFMYDSNGMAVWPKFAVDYTTKTQFLFRINKGVLDVDSSSDTKLNRYTPESDRRIPFRNMVYIGDGLTDVPCMKLVKANGGQSIAVYDVAKSKEQAEKLRENDRVNYVAPADYRENSDLDELLKTILQKIAAVDKLINLQK